MDFEDVSYKEVAPSAVHSWRKLKVECSFDDSDATSVMDPFVDEIVANWWLERQVGFYPLFLAVGHVKDDIAMTGYVYQWGTVKCWKADETIFKKAGEFDNRVLFSYKDPPGNRLVYADYDNWFLVLNSSHCDFQISDRHRRMILKPSWKPSDWLRKARKDRSSVMAVCDCLDLRKADRVWARNKPTQKALLKMGFQNVQVKRYKTPTWY